MRALNPRVVDAIWVTIEPLIPVPIDDHPLGCHRPRIPDRDCFEAILFRLVTGCSWDVAGRLGKGSETTLRTRRDSWINAGIFDSLADHAITAYDRIIGLDLTETAIDGSTHKAPCGGDGTGPSPVDRGKRGWKWSIATDTVGIPIGWVIDQANRNDTSLLLPTLDQVAARGLEQDIGTLHLDRGYSYPIIHRQCAQRGHLDTIIAYRRPKGAPRRMKQPINLGLRWAVERTNSWLSNFGQLRRNTDRHPKHRQAQIALAVALIITIKLIDWNDRWNN